MSPRYVVILPLCSSHDPLLLLHVLYVPVGYWQQHSQHQCPGARPGSGYPRVQYTHADGGHRAAQ